VTREKNKKIVLGFTKLRQKKRSLIWSTLEKPSWKLRRTSLMPPLQEAKIDGAGDGPTYAYNVPGDMYEVKL